MIDILLTVQIVIGILLIIAILLQKTSVDGVSGVGGGGGMNFISERSATAFVSKATIWLIIIFMSNALILANLSNKSDAPISKKIQKEIPMAK